MATTEKAAHRGRQRGLEAVGTIGGEIRLARRSLGLSLAATGAAVGIAASALLRIERRLRPNAPLILLAQLCEVVGLDLSVRAYPAVGRRATQPTPPSSSGFTGSYPRACAGERRSRYPSPATGAWDATITRLGWYQGVETERHQD